MTVLEILNQLATNPVFSGLMGGSVVMSALYTLRSVPERIWRLIRWRYVTEITVHSEDPSFDLIVDWLEELEYARRTRRLRLVHKYESREDGRRNRSRIVPGDGWHLAWIDRRPVVIERTTPKEVGQGVQSSKRLENIAIRAPGKSPEFLRSLVTSIIDRYETRTTGVTIYGPQYDSWSPLCVKTKRPLDSVIVSPEQRDRIVADVERFLANRETYMARGVPYRRGYLFYGPPGTGKTSFVLALASHLGKSIYVLNMGSMSHDGALINTIAGVPEDAILLIEDIDATQANRAPQKQDNVPQSKEEPQFVSLSALLNSLDGLFARDGRILIMTTNHPDRVDPALIRPGRADVREFFGELEEPEILTMCRWFLGNDNAETFAQTVKAPIAAAELQKLLTSEPLAGAAE